MKIQNISIKEMEQYVKIRELVSIAMAFNWTPSQVENEDIETIKSMLAISDAVTYVQSESIKMQNRLSVIPEYARERIIKRDKLKGLYGNANS